MATVPATTPLPPTPAYTSPELEIDYSKFITEDGKPVDGMYSERQHRLLTDALFASWAAPQGRPHWAATDVGLFYAVNKPAVVPDVMLSLDATPPDANTRDKKTHSYFTWLVGKNPDLAVEVVSNREGGELTDKLEIYRLIGIPYYVVWDPRGHISKTPLQCFEIRAKRYVACEPWFADVNLGVTTWQGEYDGMAALWLRFSDKDGQVLPTGVERALAAEQHAKTAEQRAKTAEKKAKSVEQRAAKLAERLRAAGIDPDQV